MESNSHTLSDVWQNFPEVLQNEKIKKTQLSISKIISDLNSVGKFYYYTIDVHTGLIHNCSPTVLQIHGLPEIPTRLQEIIDLIHPDDIQFVIEAEKKCIEKIKDIGMQHQMDLKLSYCFRMKVDAHHYELFHHQALFTQTGLNGELLQTLNIHTNINHLTNFNNYNILVSGINGKTFYHQMNVEIKKYQPILIPKLTSREEEILHYIANGYSSGDIAANLNLSIHTIKTHRKNILKKTDTQNSSELIRKCIEMGVLY